MKSRAVRSFWEGYRRLSPAIRRGVRKQYRLWLSDPRHPSLRFKKVGDAWSVRISDDYRAVGVMDGDTVIWYFEVAPMQQPDSDIVVVLCRS